MAQFLYRVGRFSYLHRKLALAIWIGVLVLSSVAAATLSGPTSTSFSIPGTRPRRPSTRSRPGSRRPTPPARRRASSSRRPRAAR